MAVVVVFGDADGTQYACHPLNRSLKIAGYLPRQHRVHALTLYVCSEKAFHLSSFNRTRLSSSHYIEFIIMRDSCRSLQFDIMLKTTRCRSCPKCALGISSSRALRLGHLPPTIRKLVGELFSTSTLRPETRSSNSSVCVCVALCTCA